MSGSMIIMLIIVTEHRITFPESVLVLTRVTKHLHILYRELLAVWFT